MPTVVGSIFGSARLGVGMAMLIWSFTTPFLLVRRLSLSTSSSAFSLCWRGPLPLAKGSPIAGFIVDAYGGPEAGLDAYKPAMWYAGGLSTASLCCILTIRLQANKSLRARL
jgi:hypothetical protein